MGEISFKPGAVSSAPHGKTLSRSDPVGTGASRLTM
jgi:hypothetical protein